MTHQKAETHMLTLSNTTGRSDVGAWEVAPQEESWGSQMGPSKYRPSAEQKLCPNFLSLKTNSLSPASASHMGRDGELSTETGESSRGHIPKEEDFLPQSLSTANSSPVWNGAWRSSHRPFWECCLVDTVHMHTGQWVYSCNSCVVSTRQHFPALVFILWFWHSFYLPFFPVPWALLAAGLVSILLRAGYSASLFLSCCPVRNHSTHCPLNSMKSLPWPKLGLAQPGFWTPGDWQVGNIWPSSLFM